MGPSRNEHRRRRAVYPLAVLLIVATSVVSLDWGSSSSATTYSSSLRRYPYVTDVVGNAATLNWGTDTSQTTGGATWGPVSNGSCTPSNSVAASRVSITVGSTNEYQWMARLAFPGPGTYCYRVQLGSTDLLGSDPSPQVKTAAPPGSPFSFAVVGDWGAGTPDEANVMSQIGASPASFVVTAGDNVYNSGTDTEYGDLTQGNVFPPQYLPKLGGRPIFASQGNHGFSTNLPYLQNLAAPIAAQTSGGRDQGESYCCISTLSGAHTYASSWYAFDWGSARFYVLDAAWADTQGAYQGDFLAHWNGSVAGCAPCGAELAWLKADLAAHASTPIKFAFFHYPLYADSGGQGTDTYLDGPNGLEGLLANNNVDIVFNGHAHQYERNLPQIPGKPLVDYVSGGGGDPLGSVNGCSAFDAYAIGSGSSCHAPKPTSNAQVFNFLLVTVNGNRVTVAPTDSTGQTFDQQTYTYSTTSTTVIDSPPPALTNATSASISFHATGGGSSFTCSLDGGAPAACTSPVTFTGLGSGSHSVTVTGSGATPATASWTVDTARPSVPPGLSGQAVSSHEVDLSWSASTDDTGVTGYDVLRNGVVIATVSGSTLSYADTNAAPSTTYQYAVDARDGAGNVSPPSSAVPETTPAAPPGPFFVQSAGSSTTTVTLPTPSRAGDLLVLTAGVYTGMSKPITAVSDGKNTWTKVGAYAVSGQISDGELWYAPNAVPVSSVTVTTGATTVALQLQEFGGAATTNPLDGSAGSAATGTAASSGTATPASANDLAVGFVAGHGNNQNLTVTSPGYTLQSEQATTSPSTVTVRSGYQDLGSPSAQSFTGTFPTAMYWSAGVAFFKAGTVSPPNDFSIGANPSSSTVTAGSAATTTVSTTVTSGAAQSVSLTSAGAPSGAQVSFNPPVVNAGQSSTMTVTTSSTTPSGSSSVTVTGTGSSAVHSTTFALTVDPAPTAPTITSSNQATFTEGTPGTFTVTSTGVPTPSLTVSGALPNGVGFVDHGDGTGTLSGTPGAGTAATYPLTITAGNGVGSPASQSFTLTVNPAPSNDFSIVANPTSSSVTAGSAATTTISTTVTSGTAQSVALSASGEPSGSLVSFSPQVINAGQSSTMTVTTSSTTPSGSSSVTVTGTGSSATRTVTFSLTVNPVSTTTPAFVQSASATETATSTSLTGSFPSATKAGDLLVLSAGEYTGATNHLTSVTDSAGNTWTRVGAYDVSGHNSNGELWYAANANPVTTVTAHVASAASMVFEVQEFSGVAMSNPLDTSAGTSNTGTAAGSGAVAASQANELVVGFVAGHGNPQTMTVTSPGYVNQSQQTSTGTVATVVTGFQVLGAPGSQSFAATFGTAMYWAAGVAVFRP